MTTTDGRGVRARARLVTAVGLGAALAAMALTSGCASERMDEAAPEPMVSGDWDVGTTSPAYAAPPMAEPDAQAGFGGAPHAPPAPSDGDRRIAERDSLMNVDEEMLLAQAGPGPGQPGGGLPDGGGPQRERAEGERGGGMAGGKPGAAGERGAPGQAGDPLGPLLIYTADLHLAVFEVRPTQKEIVQLALDLGGFLASQDDVNVTIRVPSRRFHEGLAKVEAAGDLLHRNVQAQDVSEQYRDIQVRLKNAEAVRDRLERLLAEAQNVEEALRVHAELARVTEQIEQFKGTIRFLSDRVAFSTIAVHFTPRPSPQGPSIRQPEVYRLPFPWLDRLGLPSLMSFN